LTSSNGRSLLRAGDVKMAAMLLAGVAPAWLLPVGALRTVARLAARVTPTPGRPIPPGLTALLADNEAVARRRLQAAFYEDCLHVLRCWAPWGGRPAVSLTGAETLRDALAAGRGAIVWVQDAAFAPLLAKAALAQAGLRVFHLSRRSHRFSDSAFGVRMLNPIQTRIEDRFLASRVIIDDRQPLPALLRIRRLLARGEVVSITAGGLAGDWVGVPFLGSTLHLPAGPMRLALDTGAPLLPLFLTRDGSGFTCHIEAPLRLSPDRGRDEAVAIAACEYARVLEDYTRVSPALWGGWMRSSLPPR
jgi:lauroyl/myristoyl acyltransferase